MFMIKGDKFTTTRAFMRLPQSNKGGVEED